MPEHLVSTHSRMHAAADHVYLASSAHSEIDQHPVNNHIASPEKAEEKYAMQAYFVHKIVTRGIQPLLNDDNNESTLSFVTLSSTAKEQLTKAFYQMNSELSNDNSSFDARAYARLKDINPNFFSAINGGINTAVQVMSRTLEVIPKLLPNGTPEDFIEIAKHNYPFIVQLAMNQDNLFTQKMIILTGQSPREPGFDFAFRASKLRLNGKHLAFSEESEQQLQRSRSNINDNAGCPAMHNPGEGNAVRLLYDWFLAHAKSIYQQENIPNKKSTHIATIDFQAVNSERQFISV